MSTLSVLPCSTGNFVAHQNYAILIQLQLSNCTQLAAPQCKQKSQQAMHPCSHSQFSVVECWPPVTCDPSDHLSHFQKEQCEKCQKEGEKPLPLHPSTSGIFFFFGAWQIICIWNIESDVFFYIKMKPAALVCFCTLKAEMSVAVSHLTDIRGIMRIFENP